jgi:hypothetical protein
MRLSRLTSRSVMVCLTIFFFAAQLSAQTATDRVAAAKARLEQAAALLRTLPAPTRKGISGSAENLLHIATGFEKVEDRGLPHRPQQAAALAMPQPAAPSKDAAPGIQVSNPAADGIYSVISGFTQSETSIAWCGETVVVGFNDSGSFWESIFSGTGGVSFNGYARSINAGASYTDLGFLNPGANPLNFLAGDPVLGCASADTFHYASLFLTGDALNPISAISVSTSRDGGATFEDPVIAAGKDGFSHFLDKPWLAVDPSSGNKLYVTYTDFDVSGIICGVDPVFGPIPRVAIEFVRSTNGGADWSAPIVLQEVCSPITVQGLFVQGSQIAIGPAGEVYVGWEFYDADYVTRTIRIRRSGNSGASFTAAVNVTAVECVGDCFALQGGFRAFFDLGSVAVDRSGGTFHGNVYLVYQSGGFEVPDAESFDGSYSYSDIWLRRSADGGQTWTAAVRVNTNPDPIPGGGGTDQYMPYASVDNTGRIAVGFYDRRRDRQNFFVDRFFAVSRDGGASWFDGQEASRSFPAIHATDALINPFYMGDYDVLTSDATQVSAGFVGAYQVISTRGNPDVVAVKRH